MGRLPANIATRPTGRELKMSEHEGLTLGHAAAEAAADRAGTKWRDTAFDSFREYAKTHEFFTTEDVRLARADLPFPPDTRAWGAIPRQAIREDIIESVGLVRADDRKVHGRFITKWRSKIYQGKTETSINPHCHQTNE